MKGTRRHTEQVMLYMWLYPFKKGKWAEQLQPFLSHY